MNKENKQGEWWNERFKFFVERFDLSDEVDEELAILVDVNIAEAQRLERERIVKELEELRDINAKATAPADDYHTGLTNGLECARATIARDSDLKYIDVAESTRERAVKECIEVVENHMPSTHKLDWDQEEWRWGNTIMPILSALNDLLEKQGEE